MKGIILLADHFEDVEALITIDILRRAKIDIELISIKNDLKLTTQSNVIIIADKLYTDIDINNYDFLIIPGGKAVFETHLNSEITKKVIEHFNNNNQLIATICAAPSILGKYGLLKNKEYVCFPSCEEGIDGILLQNEKVVVSNNLITSKAAGTTFLFAYEIVKYLRGEEVAKKVLNSVYY